MHDKHHNGSAGLLESFSIALPEEVDTIDLGKALSHFVKSGMVLWLTGDLGAGKTTLARALLRALGVTGAIKSPTYALVEVYVVSSLYLYHFDFYRFNTPSEFAEAGLLDYFRPDALCIVEWPEKALAYVPQADLTLALHFTNEGSVSAATQRLLTLSAFTSSGQQCLQQLKNHWPAVAAS